MSTKSPPRGPSRLPLQPRIWLRAALRVPELARRFSGLEPWGRCSAVRRAVLAAGTNWREAEYYRGGNTVDLARSRTVSLTHPEILTHSPLGQCERGE